MDPQEVDTVPLDQIEVKSYVGGLVKSFGRKAASRVSPQSLVIQLIVAGRSAPVARVN